MKTYWLRLPPAKAVLRCRKLWKAMACLVGRSSGGACAWSGIFVGHRHGSWRRSYKTSCHFACNSARGSWSHTSFAVQDGRPVRGNAKGIGGVPALILVILSAECHILEIVSLCVLLHRHGRVILAVRRIEQPVCWSGLLITPLHNRWGGCVVPQWVLIAAYKVKFWHHCASVGGE